MSDLNALLINKSDISMVVKFFSRLGDFMQSASRVLAQDPGKVLKIMIQEPKVVARFVLSACTHVGRVRMIQSPSGGCAQLFPFFFRL
jgi:hypothetical protein